MSDSVRPHRRQPTRLHRLWDSPGKNTGVGCRCLLQCMKVKSESEVAQSCPTLCDPMDCSPPVSSTHGIFQARALEWGAVAFSGVPPLPPTKSRFWALRLTHASNGFPGAPQAGRAAHRGGPGCAASTLTGVEVLMCEVVVTHGPSSRSTQWPTQQSPSGGILRGVEPGF